MQAARVIPGPQGGHLRIVEVPRPEAGPGQVLVRVMAAGLNRGEINIVRRALSGAELPIGVEFAGVVEAVGPQVAHWRPGDRVMGHGNGGQAEYVLAAGGALMALPEGVPWLDAAAIPNVAITAHDALVTNGGLRAGSRVLINAASSGIGLAALAIARALGAGMVVGTTRSAAKRHALRALGYDAVLDTNAGPLQEPVRALTQGQGIDILIDSVGASAFAEALDLLAVQGRLINIGRLGGALAQIDLEKLWMKRLHLIGVTFRTRSEAERIACVQACARDLAPHIASGALRVPVHRVFPLAELAQAHACLVEDRHVGKIVIAVDPSCDR